MPPQRSSSISPVGGRLLIGAAILVALVTGVIATCSASDVPLTTERLRAIVREEGISKADGVQFNRDAGRALQDAVLRSQGWEENQAKFPTRERAELTKNAKKPAAAVIPDAVDGVRETTSDPDLGSGAPVVRTYQNSTFIEVKATRKGLRLSSNSHQIAGLIDVAARSPASQAKDIVPAIIFITTSDTKIAQEVSDRATGRRVSVWQMIVYEVPHRPPAKAEIRVGPAQLLNAAVLGRKFAQGQGNFTPPVTLRPGLSPSTNIDPTEVDSE